MVVDGDGDDYIDYLYYNSDDLIMVMVMIQVVNSRRDKCGCDGDGESDGHGDGDRFFDHFYDGDSDDG